MDIPEQLQQIPSGSRRGDSCLFLGAVNMACLKLLRSLVTPPPQSERARVCAFRGCVSRGTVVSSSLCGGAGGDVFEQGQVSAFLNPLQVTYQDYLPTLNS